MFDDVEADFWKEVFVHMQHKNMVRTNAQLISKQELINESELFVKNNPQIKPEITNAESYFTWEIFISQTVKLRLFVQSQIKASLLQVENGNLVKLADGKFPYNPFPEIQELVDNKNSYLEQLTKKIDNDVKFKKQQKITGEIIKALLKKKYQEKKIIWTLEPQKNDFLLTITEKNNTRNVRLSCKNFAAEINNLD